MKKIITLLFIIVCITVCNNLKSQTQTYNFKTIKKDTINIPLNSTVVLDKTTKRIYITTNNTQNSTLIIKHYSTADKYQLIDCKDSTSNETISVQIYTGKKETYMTLEYKNNQIYTYK